MRRIIWVAAGLLVSACGATYSAPTDQFAAAQKDVGRAQEAGASNVPDAKLHLQLAQEDLAKAKGLMNSDNQRAGSLIARADAEAELARNLARQAQAQLQAQQAIADLNKSKSGN